MMRAAIVAAALAYVGAGAFAQGGAPPAKAANPAAYTKESILRGRNTYLRHCQECHDEDGKAMSNVIAAATDLTRPDAWKHGAEDEQGAGEDRDDDAEQADRDRHRNGELQHAHAVTLP